MTTTMVCAEGLVAASVQKLGMLWVSFLSKEPDDN